VGYISYKVHLVVRPRLAGNVNKEIWWIPVYIFPILGSYENGTFWGFFVGYIVLFFNYKGKLIYYPNQTNRKFPITLNLTVSYE